MDKYFDLDKCVPIHGIEINKEIDIPIEIDDKRYSGKFVNLVRLVKYDEYLNMASKFINNDSINKCDLIAIFTTQSHNTMEIQNIKIILSAIYFADRMSNTSKLKENFIHHFKEFFCGKGINEKDAIEIIEKIYENDENEYFSNYHNWGYFDNDDEIRPLYWYISLGNMKVTNDNFDKHLTRGFSYELVDEYSRQTSFNNYKYTIDIDVNNTFVEKMETIVSRLNKDDEYSQKIKSALRLYYNVLYEGDIEQSILIYASILETLLLKRNETKGQKNKVANRCACIVANNKAKEKKEFIANHVTYFYGYRNAIIHEGKSYLEIDNEVILSNIMCSIRHLIYFIIKYVVEQNIKEIKEIKKLVEINMKEDAIDDDKGYITYIKGDNSSISIIFNN